MRGKLGETSRGDPVGDVTVWVSRVNSNSNGATPRFRMNPAHWERIYNHKNKASMHTYTTLKFEEPIVLRPGQVRMMYIHSTAPSDEAIVYDNSVFNSNSRYTDDFLSIYSGKAHLSPVAFGQVPIWGWGNAWRDRREFVGQLHYGVTFQLWNPEKHTLFGRSFDKGVLAMLLAQRADECQVSRLPDECIYYIMNMCKWDWFDDNGHGLKARYRVRKRRASAVLGTGSDAMEEGSQEHIDEDADDDVEDEDMDVEEDDDDENEEADEYDSDEMDFFRAERRNPLVFEVDVASSDEEDSNPQQMQLHSARPISHGHWFRRSFPQVRVMAEYAGLLRLNMEESSDDDDDSDFSDS